MSTDVKQMIAGTDAYSEERMVLLDRELAKAKRSGLSQILYAGRRILASDIQRIGPAISVSYLCNSGEFLTNVPVVDFQPHHYNGVILTLADDSNVYIRFGRNVPPWMFPWLHVENKPKMVGKFPRCINEFVTADLPFSSAYIGGENVYVFNPLAIEMTPSQIIGMERYMDGFFSFKQEKCNRTIYFRVHKTSAGGVIGLSIGKYNIDSEELSGEFVLWNKEKYYTLYTGFDGYEVLAHKLTDTVK